jgi:hypothetical protein
VVRPTTIQVAIMEVLDGVNGRISSQMVIATNDAIRPTYATLSGSNTAVLQEIFSPIPKVMPIEQDPDFV